MWSITGAIGGYEGTWYGDIRLLLRDCTPASGCDRSNDEPGVGDADEEHEGQGTLNPATGIKVEERAKSWQPSGTLGWRLRVSVMHGETTRWRKRPQLVT